jgi:hypothetical protein
VHERELRRASTRRWRRRVHDGKAIYSVEADAAVIDMLIRMHWVAEADAADRARWARQSLE